MGYETRVKRAIVLHLHQMAKEFDIIESGCSSSYGRARWKFSKVWQANGLMAINPYSELARQHIVKLRKEI